MSNRKQLVYLVPENDLNYQNYVNYLEQQNCNVLSLQKLKAALPTDAITTKFTDHDPVDSFFQKLLDKVTVIPCTQSETLTHYAEKYPNTPIELLPEPKDLTANLWNPNGKSIFPVDFSRRIDQFTIRFYKESHTSNLFRILIYETVSPTKQAVIASENVYTNRPKDLQYVQSVVLARFENWHKNNRPQETLTCQEASNVG